MLKRLLFINGLAVIGVVLNHAHIWGFTAMFWWADLYRNVSVPNFDLVGSAPYYILRIVEQLIIFSIATFLFVSGFFISTATGRQQRTIGWKIILNRIKFLLIPYLVWCTIIIVLRLVEGQPGTLLGYLKAILTGNLEGPYYYVIMITIFYLLSPLMVPVARSRPLVLLLVAGLIQLVTQVMFYSYLLNWDIRFFPDHYLEIWTYTSRIFWYALGMVAGFHLQEFKEFLARFKWVFMVLTLVFFILGVVEQEMIVMAGDKDTVVETIIDGIFAFGFIMTFLAIDRVPDSLSRPLNALGSKSYGIYLAHVPAQTYTARLIYHLMPSLTAYQLVFAVIIFAFGLGLPLLLMNIVERSSVGRRYYRYVFG